MVPKSKSAKDDAKDNSSAKNVTAPDEEAVPLSELSIGEGGYIYKVSPKIHNLKKFADVGFIRGENICVENRAAFGGLLRVSIMNTSISLHRDEARHILVHKLFSSQCAEHSRNHHDNHHGGHSHGHHADGANGDTIKNAELRIKN